MKKPVALLLLAAVATSAFVAPVVSSAATGTTQSATTTTAEATVTITTVIDSMEAVENKWIIRRPDNGGRALQISDAMSFPEKKFRALQASQENRSAVQIVIKGREIVDVITN